MTKRFSFDQLTHRTGGWSLIIIIAIVQIIALFGAFPGMLSIRVNAEFEEQQLRTYSLVIPILIAATYLLLLGVSWRITVTARKQLDDWKAGFVKPKPEDEFLAWREITSL